MKIVLAQLKKDIRCQWDILILWIFCLVLIAIPTVILPALQHLPAKSVDFLHLSGTQKSFGIFYGVALFMVFLPIAMLGFCLSVPVTVIRVVQDDSLVDTTAFWRTRPLPRPKLLFAKALFIVLLFLPFMLPGKSGTVGDDLLWPMMAAWISALAAFAALTPKMGTCLGYGVAFLFGKGIFSAIINQCWIHFHGPGGLLSDDALRPLIEVGNYLHFNASDAFHLCYFAGFAGIFIHQYLTLRTKRSFALLVAGLVAIGVLQMLAGPADNSGPVIHIDSGSSQTP